MSATDASPARSCSVAENRSRQTSLFSRRRNDSGHLCSNVRNSVLIMTLDGEPCLGDNSVFFWYFLWKFRHVLVSFWQILGEHSITSQMWVHGVPGSVLLTGKVVLLGDQTTPDAHRQDPPHGLLLPWRGRTACGSLRPEEAKSKTPKS